MQFSRHGSSTSTIKLGVSEWSLKSVWTHEEMAGVDVSWERYGRLAMRLGIVKPTNKQKLAWTWAFTRKIIDSDNLLPSKEDGPHYSMQRFYAIAKTALNAHIGSRDKVSAAEKRRLLYFICEGYRIQEEASD
jgi:hypothetical protein